jgi:hypothetical protein
VAMVVCSTTTPPWCWEPPDDHLRCSPRRRLRGLVRRSRPRPPADSYLPVVRTPQPAGNGHVSGVPQPGAWIGPRLRASVRSPA